ncbi:CDP-diacylglycerol--glycerol-3-phosphate 3-phosphatidyltransferase [Humibacillus sp. DSM 29435]|uniref:CDP-alcohol phosphatidyltransferase family protein n=1 Tax=Humibacillus sp. DSM 29435 TaxID=1869167 RepID=UPI000871BFF5|nr:CDP-alcohol phosphatidyltransferase family protein [Humibacillus sp. DSM 29435]OFE17372.1 CDP-diacylglycerol--glycerol-3-phosphate 3-phosphatidyltransferase [Humibacillus sp. DSM 29435]
MNEDQAEAAEPAGASERVLTLPNALSTLRLLGVPVFLWAILDERDLLALVILMLSGITDYLDGKIARAFNMESRVGAFLDPIADRLYILTTMLGLVWRDIIPVWLVVALLAREAVMAVMLLYLRGRGQTGLPVHFVGKAATFNLLYAFPMLLLAHRDDWIGELARPIGWGFAWWGVSLYWLSVVLYAVQAKAVLGRTRRAST